MDKIKHILKEYFGFSNFRALQEESIKAIIEGRDILTILPTGGGKSLCYQLPALYFKDKITIVISPLIALINDQVYNLNANGIKAVKLTSELSKEEATNVYKELRSGNVNLLYVSPERVANEAFREFLKSLNIAFFVIDEAHCVSEWGHEFRPDYRNLSILKDEFPNINIAAFTATATKRVTKDIINSLKLKNPQILKGSFFRKNLLLSVQKREKNGRGQLLTFLKKYKNESGIIYTFTRKEAESLAIFLQKNNISARAYHAGLESSLKKKLQELFINDEIDIVVATVAFGMGIDKSNVRFVVHMDLPKSIEGYYQEIGRAGRDGLESECLMLYSMGDMLKKIELIEKLDEQIYKNVAINKLEELYTYANATKCRHQMLSSYFEEEIEPCKKYCDNCLSEPLKEIDITKEAQMFLSAIYRTKQSFGKSYIIDILRGSKNQKILENGHNELSVYNIGSNISKKSWDLIADKLFELKAIKRGDFRELKLSQIGADILKGKIKVRANEDIFNKKDKAPSIKKSFAYKDENFEKLRALRLKLAKENSVPPYIIFSDATLKEMASKKPKTKEEFLAINGVGEMKLKKYGDEFLELIKTFNSF